MATALVLTMALIVGGPVRAGQSSLSERLVQVQGLLAEGQFATALTEARAIVAEAAAAGAPTEQAAAELRVSDALYYLGRHLETLAPMQRALVLYRQLNDLAGIGRTYYSLAYFYERTAPDSMLALLAEGKIYAAQAADRQLQMNIANATGVAFWNQGDYVAAAPEFEQSIALARELGDEPARASANQNLGILDYHQGYCAAALTHYEQALAAFQAVGNRHSEAVTLGNIGNAYFSLGDPETGLEYDRRALALDRENGYRRGVATQVNNLAEVNWALDNLTRAEALWTEARKLAPEIGDERTAVYATVGLGRCALRAGDTARGRQLYTEALLRARQLGDPYVTMDPLRRLTELNFASGDTAVAWRQLEQAEAMAARLGASYQQGILAGMRGEQLARSGRLDAAIKAYRQAIALHEATHTRNWVFGWRAALAGLSLQQSDSGAAETAYQQSLVDIASLDAVIATGAFRRHLFAMAASVYQDYAAWYLWRGDVRAAWEILERGRARDLSFRLLQARRAGGAETAEQVALQRIGTLQKRLQDENLDQSEREQLRHWIVEAETEYDRTRWVAPGSSAQSLAPVALNAPEGTLRVMFSVHNDTLAIFRAWGDQLAVRLVPEAGALYQRCAIFADLVADPASAETWRPVSRALGQILLGPELAAHPVQQLVILPDPGLWRLPFAALTLDDGRLVAEVAPISLAPSVRSLRDIRQHSVASGTAILAVAGGGDSTSAWQPLPAARIEAEEVAGMGRPAKLLIGAGEAEFKAQSVAELQILHFASHVQADPRHPERAGIVLGSGPHEDGILQAREIYGLPLSARLTVVSGCRGGDGGVASGEGLLGLSHALLSAGSHSVVLSRWNLADRGAAAFMTDFYGQMSGHTVAEALQSARLACLQSPAWRHPAYWAGYFVTGDGQQVCRLPGPRHRLGLGLAAMLLVVGVYLMGRRYF